MARQKSRTTSPAKEMAPTLFTSCNALPPEGAVLAWGGPARRTLAPTLLASRSLLPLAPGDGAELRLGRPGASFAAPTLVASRTALPPEGVVLAWGGPARRTSAATPDADGFQAIAVLSGAA